MKLTKRQLDALQESIYHWYENLYLALAGLGITADSGTCALCNYLGCYWCPVAKGTGQTDCDGSPYNSVIECTREAEHNRVRLTEIPQVVYIECICAEIHFLESLDKE